MSHVLITDIFLLCIFPSDPVTRGLSILVNWLGFKVDVSFPILLIIMSLWY